MKKVIFYLFVGLVPMNYSFSSDNGRWERLTEVESVEIQTLTTLCDRPDQGTSNEYKYIKLINKSDRHVSVSFEKEIWYNGDCFTCERKSDEYTVSFVLNPGQEIAGNCRPEGQESALRIFSRMPSGFTKSVLTGFKLNNINVTPIEQ